MKWLVTALFLLCSSPLIAQHSYWEADIDSVQRVLATQQEDTARLHTILHLLDLARLDEARERTQALQWLDELFLLNQRTPTLNDSAYRLLRRGVAHWSEDKKPATILALREVQQAVEQFDRLGRPIPQLLIEIAPLFNRLNQTEERFAFYRDKLAYYRLHGPIENTAACYLSVGGYYRRKGAFNQAISSYLRAAELLKRFDRALYISELKVAGSNYAEWGNDTKALEYLLQSVRLAQAYARQGGRGVDAYTYRSISKVYLHQQNYAAALRYANLALSVRGRASLNREEEQAYGLVQKSVVLLAMRNTEPVAPLLRRAQVLADSLPMPITGRRQGEFELDAAWARYFTATGDFTRAEAAWRTAYQKAAKAKFTVLRWKYLRELSNFYGARQQPAQAQRFAQAYLNLSDTLTAAQGIYNVAQYEGERQEEASNAQIAALRQHQAVQALRLEQRNRLLGVALAAILLISGLGGFIYRQLQINKRTLAQLRQTQNQLVASEKWAFVGELSAGIAHELQNPLNFMKKFAEVSTSMVDGMNKAADGQATELEHEILRGLRQNLQEISQHGVRASSIIKDMLAHSRAGTGPRIPTDLNVLTREYLQLASQSQPKDFAPTLHTHLDDQLPPVPVVPPDMGRVLLNLCSNALDAVRQRQQAGEAGYEPAVTVSTRQLPGHAEIRVRDNGPGISLEVQNKVFRPFFTTKPVGQGTGLGLSISHDIVKGHGGTLSVESREGEYTEFVVCLPV